MGGQSLTSGTKTHCTHWPVVIVVTVQQRRVVGCAPEVASIASDWPHTLELFIGVGCGWYEAVAEGHVDSDRRHSAPRSQQGEAVQCILCQDGTVAD